MSRLKTTKISPLPDIKIPLAIQSNIGSPDKPGSELKYEPQIFSRSLKKQPNY